MRNIAQWILKKQSSSQVLLTRQRWCIFHPLQISTRLPLSAVFSVTRDALPLFSGERWPLNSTPPVHSRTLETSWDLLTGIIPSCHWDMCLHVHFPSFVSAGLRQPGHKAEALLQSRLHWLAHVQPPGHVSHHATLSAALWLPWWVSWLSPQQTSEFYNSPLLLKKNEGVGGVWQSFTVHFKVQKEWKNVCDFF